MPSGQLSENIELSELEAGAPLPVRCPRWHPKMTPYRTLSLLLPACLGTMKAVASQQGHQNEPITLEWISGVVVFILLFNTGTYERRPIHRIPAYLAWLFKYDCMDSVWWIRTKASRGALVRPQYISDEVQVEERGTIYFVTAYRLLVCVTVVALGGLKAALTYIGISTGATWVEWTLGVFITSVLYIAGLYESNTIGLWSSFFGTDCSHVALTGLEGTFKLVIILGSLFLTLMWFFIERPYNSSDGSTSTELPLILSAYNLSVKIIIEGAFVLASLSGAVMFLGSLMVVRADLGDRLRLPLRVRVFCLWAASFATSAYALPTHRRTQRLTPMFALNRTWSILRFLVFTFRYPLSFLLAVCLALFGFSMFAGQAYRLATGDFVFKTPDGADRGPGWNVVGYVAWGVGGTAIVGPAAVVIVWSTRKMFRVSRDVWVARCLPLLRIAIMRMKERGQRMKWKMNKAAVSAVLSLSGLSEQGAVHHAYDELVRALRTADSYDLISHSIYYPYGAEQHSS